MFKLMDGGNQTTGNRIVNSSISTYDWFSYDDKKNYEINLKNNQAIGYGEIKRLPIQLIVNSIDVRNGVTLNGKTA
jgi:hypothetical protein